MNTPGLVALAFSAFVVIAHLSLLSRISAHTAETRKLLEKLLATGRPGPR